MWLDVWRQWCRRAILVTLAWVFLPTLVGAEIWKCPDGQGGQVIKNEPCAGAWTTPTAPPRPPAASTTPNISAPRNLPPPVSQPAVAPIALPQERESAAAAREQSCSQAYGACERRCPPHKVPMTVDEVKQRARCMEPCNNARERCH